MDLIGALRKLHADTVLVDEKGKVWTAEDLEYTLLDEAPRQWRMQEVQLQEHGIYRIDREGKPVDRLYLITEEVSFSG